MSDDMPTPRDRAEEQQFRDEVAHGVFNAPSGACEICGGTGTYPELVDGREMPCGCDDGREMGWDQRERVECAESELAHVKAQHRADYDGALDAVDQLQAALDATRLDSDRWRHRAEAAEERLRALVFGPRA